MTQEEKELLLKDLCARLFNGVIVDIKYSKENGSSDRLRICSEGSLILNTDLIGLYVEEEIHLKPYLRPMSSMTVEEQLEYSTFGFSITEHINANRINCPTYTVIETKEVYAISFIMDWLNAHHFDYRGLIEKGLAIDCTNLNIY